jgi:hypothetical protein
MSSDIITFMKELKNIYAEIKRINHHLKNVRDRKAYIETQILDYLERVDEPGIMYEDITVLRHKKVHRQRKPVLAKKEDVVHLLEDAGVGNAEKLYNDIQEKMKGEAESVPTLKVKEKKRNE